MSRPSRLRNREELAQLALRLYQEHHTVREVAAELKISYGSAHTLIREAGGEGVFRHRGSRA